MTISYQHVTYVTHNQNLRGEFILSDQLLMKVGHHQAITLVANIDTTLKEDFQFLPSMMQELDGISLSDIDQGSLNAFLEECTKEFYSDLQRCNNIVFVDARPVGDGKKVEVFADYSLHEHNDDLRIVQHEERDYVSYISSYCYNDGFMDTFDALQDNFPPEILAEGFKTLCREEVPYEVLAHYINTMNDTLDDQLDTLLAIGMGVHDIVDDKILDMYYLCLQNGHHTFLFQHQDCFNTQRDGDIVVDIKEFGSAENFAMSLTDLTDVNVVYDLLANHLLGSEKDADIITCYLTMAPENILSELATLETEQCRLFDIYTVEHQRCLPDVLIGDKNLSEQEIHF